MSSTTAPLRRRILTGVIWSALVAVLLGGLALTSGPESSIQAPANPAVTVIDPATQVLAASGPVDRPFMTDGIENWRGAWGIESLPAWRWTTIALDADDSGFGGVTRGFPSAVGTLLLAAAQLVWTFLLWMLRFALDSGDILVYAAGPINAGAAALGRFMLAFAVVLMGIVLFRTLQAFTGRRRAGGRPGMVLLRGVTVIALLVVVTQQSISASATYNPQALAAYNTAVDECYTKADKIADLGAANQTLRQCLENVSSGAGAVTVTNADGTTTTITPQANLEGQLDYVGTLPWFAHKVSGFADSVTEGLMLVEGIASESGQSLNGYAEGPNCATYISGLKREFLDNPSNSRQLASASSLWENTFYRSWAAMQFGQSGGGYDLPNTVMCRFAETLRRTGPIEQQTIEGYASGGSPIATPAGTKTRPVFGPFSDMSSRDARLATTAWVACTYSGGKWVTAPAFKYAMGKENALDDNCNAIFSKDIPEASASQKTSGRLLGLLKGVTNLVTGNETAENANPLAGIQQDVPLATIYAKDGWALTESVKAGNLNDVAAAQKFMSAYKGNNGGDRMLQGLLALVVALMFMFTLGVLALGDFLAQFGLVALLLLTPIFLGMWAVGATRRSWQMFRLTLTFAVSSTLFGILLSVTIALSRAFQQISSALVGPIVGAGLVRNILFGLSPVIAFYIVKRIIRAFGLESITTFSGALGFVAGASMLATGDKQLQAIARVDGRTGQSALGNALRKAPGMQRAEKLGADNLTRQTMARTNPLYWTKERREGRDAARAQARTARWETRNRRMAARGNSGVERQLNRLDKAAGVGQDKLGQFSQNMAARAALGAGAVGASGGLAVVAGAAGVFAGAAAAGGIPAAILAARQARRDRDSGIIPRPDADATLPEVNSLIFTDGPTARASSIIDRQRIESLSRANLGDRPRVLREYLDSALDTHARARLRLDAGDPFVGFSSPGELGAYREALALQMGIDPEDILVGYSGLAGIRPMTREQARESIRSMDAWRDVSLWLGDAYNRQAEGESIENFLARRHSELFEAGYLTADGRTVDAFTVMGLDPNSASTQTRFQRWIDGNPDKLFDSFTIDYKNVDSAAMRRAGQFSQEWVTQRMSSIAEDHQSYMNALIEGLQSAQRAMPEHGSTLDRLNDQFLNVLAQHEKVVTDYKAGVVEKAAVLGNWKGVVDALDSIKRASAEAELDRQTIEMAIADTSAGLDKVVDGVNRSLESLNDQLEQLERDAAAAMFDNDRGINRLLGSMQQYTDGLRTNFGRTSERATERVSAVLREAEATIAAASVREEAAQKRFTSARRLVESAARDTFPGARG